MSETERVINDLVEHIEGALEIDSDYVDCVRTDLLQVAVGYLKLANAQQWISVKDRSPDMNGTYLVVRKRPTRAVTLAWYSGEYGWLALDGVFYADGVITHFMPLPEPPKEEEHADGA